MLQWVWNNKRVKNKNKKNINIEFGLNSKLKPQLNLFLTSVPIEQLEEIRLLEVMLDRRLKWLKHIENMVIVMGRGLSVIKRCATFLPQYCISQIEQTMVLTYLDSCPVVWSSTSSKDLEKWQFVQNKVTQIHCKLSPKFSHIKK